MAFAALLAFLIPAGCFYPAVPIDRQMAICTAEKPGKIWPKAEQFWTCMGGDDFHLTDYKGCRTPEAGPSYLHGPTVYALREQKCWRWGPTNWL